MNVPSNASAQFYSLFVSRIPAGKSEDHLQKIFSFHYTGSLISLSRNRDPCNSQKKLSFQTATVVIPAETINVKEQLQQALRAKNGFPIEVAPLGKLFFKLKMPNKNDQIALLKREIEQMKVQHANEINQLTKRIQNLELHWLQTNSANQQFPPFQSVSPAM